MPTPRLAVALFALAPLAAACDQKDPAKCQEAQATIQAAVKQRQFAQARQWREYAYKQCADTAALGALDQQLSAGEAALQKEKAREIEARPLMELFSRFVAEHSATAEKASAAPVCPAEGQPDFGFCTGSRAVAGSTSSIEVRYRQGEAGSFRYTVKGPGAGTCAALGGQAGRTWQVTQRTGGVARRTHCKLSGLDAVVSADDVGTQVTVASPGFLRLDPNLKRQIQSEGL